jgi:peptide/nickel transport system ATP-binding protein
MHRGRIVETNTTAEILSHPKRDYTRDLLQAVPSLTPRPVRAETSTQTVLQANDLSKIFVQRAFFRPTRETVAAEGVNFTLKRGRTLGVVGESGSGKSTVARCVTRLIAPTSGGIRVGGQEISGLSRSALHPHRKRIQMVFQDPYRSLNPRVTVGESIAEGPVNFGTPRGAALKRAGELMALVGLPPEAVIRFPHEFSGGQRQRIAIARALAMEPDVLVADEAVSALDVSVQAQVLALLGALQQRLGVAILFITHDLRVAAQICDDVAVMQKGRIVEYGPAETVLRHPAETYTRELLEAAPGRHWDFANFRPLAAEAAS